jgi:hypothetical protein
MNQKLIATSCFAVALTAFIGCGVATAAENKGVTAKTAATSTVTNDNGSVSRTFVESSITTNGNLVTEHRRETRTNMDLDGNVLQTTTSEYAQSYSVGETGWSMPSSSLGEETKPVNTDTFLGMTFGQPVALSNHVTEAGSPALLRTVFTPKKPLAGFEDYYVYVTPKTHRIVKICACAKNAIEPGGRWRRHYLLEALEKRYRTWARLASWSRPYYTFIVAPDRYVTACLTDASDHYETVLSAWDESLVREAEQEYEQIREQARKTAAEKRNRRVLDAADAF